MGEQTPRGAKPNPDHRTLAKWIDQLTDAELSQINNRLQAKLELLYPWSTRGRAAIERPEASPPMAEQASTSQDQEDGVADGLTFRGQSAWSPEAPHGN